MPSTLQLRRSVAGLAVIANRDLDPVWSQVLDAVATRDALIDLLPGIVDRYGSAAATIAADWYDDLRYERAVRGRFRAIPAEPDIDSAPVLARLGVGPLFGANPDLAAAQTLVLGGLQRRVANAARRTITGSSVADPQARGWQRVGGGSSCDFCSMLLGRGAVYSEATADFEAHDHCNCSAEPAFV